MGMVESTATTINYPIDMEVVSALIDQLCSMSKVVNGKESKAK